MSPYIGQRLSFGGYRCTVRYVGHVKGKEGDWLGIEWDDPSKGRHNGTHDGVKYFSCRLKSSFIRPSRQRDPAVSFNEALVTKYAAGNPPLPGSEEEEIRIGGKTVEEVGFQKIREIQRNVSQLGILILDGCRIAGINDEPLSRSGTGDSGNVKSRDLLRLGLKAVELDLSNNLIEDWGDVVLICDALPGLRSLVLDGNEFNKVDTGVLLESVETFTLIENLGLANTGFEWDLVISLTNTFPALKHLHLARNRWAETLYPYLTLRTSQITGMDLSINFFRSINSIAALSMLPCLEVLSLAYNPIEDTSNPHSVTFGTLKTLNLTGNKLMSLALLNSFPTWFPALTHLLTKDSFMGNHPSSQSLTTARLSTLTRLNHSEITPRDRFEAEIYYLNKIAFEITLTSSQRDINLIISQHPRYSDLCQLHGNPQIVASNALDRERAAGQLGARTAEITFSMAASNPTNATRPPPNPNTQANTPLNPSHYSSFTHAPQSTQLRGGSLLTETTPTIIEKTKRIPLTTDIYRLQGIAGRLFNIDPFSCKLTLETDEFDPVAGDEGDSWSVSEDSSDEDEVEPEQRIQEAEGAKNGKDEGRGRHMEEGEMEAVNADDTSKQSADNTLKEREQSKQAQENKKQKDQTKEKGQSADDTLKGREQSRKRRENRKGKEKGKWLRREEALPPSTKALGDWVRDPKARIRVEVR